MDEMKMDKRGWTAYLQDKSPQELAKLAKENNIRISDIPGVENKIDKLSDILGMPEEFKKIVYGGKEAPKATVDAEGRLKLPPRTPSTSKPTSAVAVPVERNKAQMAKQLEEIMARDIAKEFKRAPEMPELKNLTREKILYKKALPYAGPAMAAGEVLAGENDIGKMAAGVIGSDLLATLGSAAPGNAIVKGIATGTGAVAGYPLGQAVYQKVVPESVQEKLKLSPEDRMKIKEMISKGKSGIKSILRPLPAGVPKGSVPVGDAGFYKTPEGKLVQTMFPKK